MTCPIWCHLCLLNIQALWHTYFVYLTDLFKPIAPNQLGTDQYSEGSLFRTVYINRKVIIPKSFYSERSFFLHACLWKFIISNAFYPEGSFFLRFFIPKVIIPNGLFSEQSLFWKVIMPNGLYSKRSLFRKIDLSE